MKNDLSERLFDFAVNTIKYCRSLIKSKENELFIKQMNESGADIFWIGLGAPSRKSGCMKTIKS